MTLLLVFVLLTLGLFALFLGGSVVAHGFLYQQPANRLPVRALAGGLLMAGFLTLWTNIDKNRPGVYDTFFNFAAYKTTEFNEFEAVRWTSGLDGNLKADASGKPEETLVKFKRSVGGKGAQFLEEGTNEAFKLNGSTASGVQYMTGAIRVKGPEDPQPVRYNALLKEDARTKAKSYTQERRFVEEKGSRYVEVVQLGTLFVPSTGTIAIALSLNFALLVTWFIVSWPILRYSLGHAIVLTLTGTLVTMLLVMPLLFKFNQLPKPAPAPASTAMILRAGSVSDGPR